MSETREEVRSAQALQEKTGMRPTGTAQLRSRGRRPVRQSVPMTVDDLRPSSSLISRGADPGDLRRSDGGVPGPRSRPSTAAPGTTLAQALVQGRETGHRAGGLCPLHRRGPGLWLADTVTKSAGITRRISHENRSYLQQRTNLSALRPQPRPSRSIRWRTAGCLQRDTGHSGSGHGALASLSGARAWTPSSAAALAGEPKPPRPGRSHPLRRVSGSADRP
jgi:hypothetical protein